MCVAHSMFKCSNVAFLSLLQENVESFNKLISAGDNWTSTLKSDPCTFPWSHCRIKMYTEFNVFKFAMFSAGVATSQVSSEAQLQALNGVLTDATIAHDRIMVDKALKVRRAPRLPTILRSELNREPTLSPKQKYGSLWMQRLGSLKWIISWRGWFSERFGYLQLWGQDFFRSCSFMKWKASMSRSGLRRRLTRYDDSLLWSANVEKSFSGRSCTCTIVLIVCHSIVRSGTRHLYGRGWKRVEWFVWFRSSEHCSRWAATKVL